MSGDGEAVVGMHDLLEFCSQVWSRPLSCYGCREGRTQRAEAGRQGGFREVGKNQVGAARLRQELGFRESTADCSE